MLFGKLFLSYTWRMMRICMGVIALTPFIKDFHITCLYMNIVS